MKLTLETKYEVGDRVIAYIWYDRQRGEKGTVISIYTMNERVYYCVKLDSDNTVIRVTSGHLWELEKGE